MINVSLSGPIAAPIVSGRVSNTRSALQLGMADLANLTNAAIFDAALASTTALLFRLRGLRDNWDGNGSAAPERGAIVNAVAMLRRFYDQSWATGYPWNPPHVASNEVGEVTFEWWQGRHKLTIYLTSGGASFLKVWGPHIDEDMADGEIVGDCFTGLWRWLHASL